MSYVMRVPGKGHMLTYPLFNLGPANSVVYIRLSGYLVVGGHESVALDAGALHKEPLRIRSVSERERRSFVQHHSSQ